MFWQSIELRFGRVSGNEDSAHESMNKPVVGWPRYVHAMQCVVTQLNNSVSMYSLHFVYVMCPADRLESVLFVDSST